MAEQNTSQTPAVPVGNPGSSGSSDGQKPAEVTATPTPAPAAPATPVPETPKHSPWTIQRARDQHLNEQDIQAASPEELERLVYHLERQRAALQVAPQAAAPAPAKPPEPEWTPPEALRGKLGEVDPTVLEFIQAVGKDAAKTRDLEAKLAQIEAQRQAEVIEREIHASMNRHPVLGTTRPPDGSPEDFRRATIINHLAALERAGQLRGLNRDQAIEMSVKYLFGGQAGGVAGGGGTPTPASPPPPPPPPGPTTLPRPGGRIIVDEDTPLVDLWRRAQEEAEDEEKRKNPGGSVFKP